MASPSLSTVAFPTLEKLSIDGRPARKVCLLCYALPENSNKLHRDLYVFDLDPKLNPSPDFISLAPAIRFEISYLVAYCVLNSTLFLFDGHHCTLNPNGKSVRAFDIPSSPDSVSGEPNVVPLDSTESCPPMHGLKRLPVAIPTPDHQRVLVFSTKIFQFGVGDEGFIHFELYDHVNRSWEQLPPFPDNRMGNERKVIEVRAYSFIDDSTFLINTRDGKSFTLNHHLNGTWTWDEFVGGFNLESFLSSPSGRFYVLGGGQFCVSRARLYDLIQCSTYKLPPNLDADEELAADVFEWISSPSISYKTMTHIDPQTFCVFFSNYIGDKMDDLPIPTTDIDIVRHPHVYIDVYEMRSDGTPTKTKSYKFRLSTPYSQFFVSALFPI